MLNEVEVRVVQVSNFSLFSVSLSFLIVNFISEEMIFFS